MDDMLALLEAGRAGRVPLAQILTTYPQLEIRKWTPLVLTSKSNPRRQMRFVRLFVPNHLAAGLGAVQDGGVGRQGVHLVAVRGAVWRHAGQCRGKSVDRRSGFEAPGGRQASCGEAGPPRVVLPWQTVRGASCGLWMANNIAMETKRQTWSRGRATMVAAMCIKDFLCEGRTAKSVGAVLDNVHFKDVGCECTPW